MKKLFSIGILGCALMLCVASVSYGQKKADETQQSAYSGPIIRQHNPSDGANLSNLFNMKMHQSLSASVGTFGGYVMNTEAFTNSMDFFFSKNLTGQLDISLLTSPFTQNNFYGVGAQKNLQFALDAQLNYQINKNLDVHLEINKAPAGYGYYPGAYGRYGAFPYRGGPIFEH